MPRVFWLWSEELLRVSKPTRVFTVEAMRSGEISATIFCTVGSGGALCPDNPAAANSSGTGSLAIRGLAVSQLTKALSPECCTGELTSDASFFIEQHRPNRRAPTNGRDDFADPGLWLAAPSASAYFPD